MKARVKWVEARCFTGEVEAGHRIVLGSAHEGSPKPGPSPTVLRWSALRTSRTILANVCQRCCAARTSRGHAPYEPWFRNTN